MRTAILLAAFAALAAMPAHAQGFQSGGSWGSSPSMGGGSSLGGSSSMGGSSLGGSSLGGSSSGGGSSLGSVGGLMLFGMQDSSPYARSSTSPCMPGEVALSTGCLNLDVDPATGRANNASPLGSFGLK